MKGVVALSILGYNFGAFIQGPTHKFREQVIPRSGSYLILQNGLAPYQLLIGFPKSVLKTKCVLPSKQSREQLILKFTSHKNEINNKRDLLFLAYQF